MEMHGVHNFQIGGNADLMHYNVNKSLNGNPLYKFIDDPANGHTFAQPFEVDYGIGNPLLKTSNNEYGIYGQDTWTVNPRLTVNLGLRWDYESHQLDESYVTPANIVAGLTGKISSDYFSNGSQRKAYKDEFQPRLGFTYDVTGYNKSIVFGGFGRYYDRLFLNATLDERYRLQFPVYRIDFTKIPFKPEYFTKAGLDALIATGATSPEIFLLNNNTKPPYADQFNLG